LANNAQACEEPLGFIVGFEWFDLVFLLNKKKSYSSKLKSMQIVDMLSLSLLRRVEFKIDVKA
jgi:hypothetical protein